MKRYVLIVCMISFFGLACGQEVNLQECIELALTSYAKSNNSVDFQRIGILKQETLSKNFLPGVEWNAKASYQSDVVSFDLDLPFEVDFPQMPHFQYAGSLQANQLIYDAGLTNILRKVTEKETNLKFAENDIELLNRKALVERYYLNILVLDGQLRILELTSEVMDDALRELKAANRLEVITMTELYNLEAEIVDLKQNILSSRNKREQLISSLNIICETDYSAEARFLTPILDEESFKINRPEYRLFDNKADLLSLQQDLLAVNLKPKLNAFGQGGYGRPGLNILSDQWNFYFMAGINMKWAIWDWRKTEKQQAVLGIEQDILNRERVEFERSLNLKLTEAQSKIDEITQLLDGDRELVNLRSQIAENSQIKLLNGILTTRQYIEDLNAERVAKSRLKIREIELIAAKINYKSMSGY